MIDTETWKVKCFKEFIKTQIIQDELLMSSNLHFKVQIGTLTIATTKTF